MGEVANPEIICWGCGAGEWFKHILRGCGRVFFSKKYTTYFFSRGASAHPRLHLGPPLHGWIECS
ncbi:hypothetical protein Hanom_Chr09g00798131 [Helianthus anomalus]